MEKSLNVHQRLNEIKKAVAYIRKDARVQNYRAVTHDAVTAETRDHFIAHGVLVVPHEIESKFVDTGAVSANQTPSMRFEGKYRVDFINVDEPTQVVSEEFSAHALDFGDKAPGKAHSYAVKYAILKILQIETGEDEEGRQPTNAPPVSPISADQKTAINDKLKELGKDWGALATVCETLFKRHVDELSDLTSDEAVRALAFLNKKASK